MLDQKSLKSRTLRPQEIKSSDFSCFCQSAASEASLGLDLRSGFGLRTLNVPRVRPWSCSWFLLVLIASGLFHHSGPGPCHYCFTVFFNLVCVDVGQWSGLAGGQVESRLFSFFLFLQVDLSERQHAKAQPHPQWQQTVSYPTPLLQDTGGVQTWPRTAWWRVHLDPCQGLRSGPEPSSGLWRLLSVSCKEKHLKTEPEPDIPTRLLMIIILWSAVLKRKCPVEPWRCIFLNPQPSWFEM